MKIVGLTGGIGSGKSTVAAMFEDLKVPVYYSDIEAKNLMNTSKKIREGLLDLLGEKAYESGRLNRAYIAEIVFKNKELLERLNGLVHPEVRKHFKDWNTKQKTSYTIQENPLIFENNSQKDFDAVITVTAPELVRIQRVMNRDQLSERQVRDRMNNQLKDSIKLERSNFVIMNDDLAETKKQVLKIHQEILSQIP